MKINLNYLFIVTKKTYVDTFNTHLLNKLYTWIQILIQTYLYSTQIHQKNGIEFVSTSSVNF